MDILHLEQHCSWFQIPLLTRSRLTTTPLFHATRSGLSVMRTGSRDSGPSVTSSWFGFVAIAAPEPILRYYVAAGYQNKAHTDNSAHDYERRTILVKNITADAYFQHELPTKAVQVLGQTMNSLAGDNFTCTDAPFPITSTYTYSLPLCCVLH